VLIRRETPSDRRAIFALHNAAFATEGGAPTYEAILVDELRAAGDIVEGLSLVADLDGLVVGHVLGSRAHIEELPTLGLGPLAVLPHHQQRGAGSALMHTVLGAADALGFPEAVLLGDPRYYQRFGFKSATTLGVIPPDPQWAEHFQVRTLTGWNAERVGRFHYAAAFGIT
jgi:putative acetyltransferase